MSHKRRQKPLDHVQIEVDINRLGIDDKTPCFFREDDECQIVLDRDIAGQPFRIKCSADWCSGPADSPLRLENGGKVEVVGVERKERVKPWIRGLM